MHLFQSSAYTPPPPITAPIFGGPDQQQPQQPSPSGENACLEENRDKDRDRNRNRNKIPIGDIFAKVASVFREILCFQKLLTHSFVNSSRHMYPLGTYFSKGTSTFTNKSTLGKKKLNK